MEFADNFERRGFAVVPNLLSPKVANGLLRRLKSIPPPLPPEKTIRERSGVVRSIYYERGDDIALDALVRVRDLVGAAEILLKSAVYVYQLKLNVKAAREGDIWAWHQDYIFWREGDSMPGPRVLTAAILLEDVNPSNGPLKIIPMRNSGELLNPDCYEHKIKHSSAYEKDLAADLSFHLKDHVVANLIRENGLSSIEGRAGDAVFFSGTAIHGSSVNESSSDRHMLFVTYNSIHNVRPLPIYTRPHFLANRDPTAIPSASIAELEAALDAPPVAPFNS